MNTVLYLDLVDEWHHAMCYRWPAPILPDLDRETCELRVRLIDEELTELMEAIANENQCGQLDACCDLQYVISGAALALGVRSFYSAAVTLIKPGDYTLADLRPLLTQFAESAFGGNSPWTWMTLARLENALHSVIKSLGFSEVFDAAFQEVHQSNMGKFWDTMDFHSGADTFQRNSLGKYIARRADGKIKKPPGFLPPDLSRFIK